MGMGGGSGTGSEPERNPELEAKLRRVVHKDSTADSSKTSVYVNKIGGIMDHYKLKVGEVLGGVRVPEEEIKDHWEILRDMRVDLDEKRGIIHVRGTYVYARNDLTEMCIETQHRRPFHYSSKKNHPYFQRESALEDTRDEDSDPLKLEKDPPKRTAGGGCTMTTT